MKRTTHRSSRGTKLYAVRDKDGKFRDIQIYKRAHSTDLRRKGTRGDRNEFVYLVVRDGAVFPAKVYRNYAAAKQFCGRRDKPGQWNVYRMVLR